MLVNDIWGGELLKGGPPSGTRRSGSTTSPTACGILRLAIDTHLITSHSLLPLLIDRPRRPARRGHRRHDDYNASRYRISVFYDLAKVAVNRLAFSLGHELAPHGGDRGRAHPGWLRSELMLEAFGVTEADWRDCRAASARRPASPRRSRHASSGAPSPRSPPTRTAPAGTSSRSTAGALAAEYGFTDVDGSQPDVWRYMADAEPGLAGDATDYR